jgi:DNA (cytosine-5)-methyltransferase 1
MTTTPSQKKSRHVGVLSAVDLFSGCGGLTLGLKQAGFKVIGAVEKDLLSAETYKKNHPKTTVWQTDIEDIKPIDVLRTLKLRKGTLDMLAGCPPCQGFSTLVTKNGKRRIDDPRNKLIYDFLRFVEGLVPKTIMMENVPDLAKTMRFKRFCKRLRDLGYRVEYRILNVADYGVPQRRKRLVVLGSRFGTVPFPEHDAARLTVKSALSVIKHGRLPHDPLHDVTDNRAPHVRKLIKEIPKNGGSRTDLSNKRQLRCHKSFDGFRDVYGRMAWDDVAPTITSGCINPSKGRFLHPTKNRTITLREAALLQSLPVGYHISLRRGKYAAAAMIGNALPPEFARRHALSVRRHLKSLR